jgi:hypothetical protein
MATKRPVNKWWKTEGVCGELFEKKSDLEQRIRGIVAKYPRESDMSEQDVAFLCAVFAHHHEWDVKQGSGVAGMFTRLHPAWSGPTTGIMIRRTDGSEIDISWVTALQPGGSKTSKGDASRAARFEVVGQRDAVLAAVVKGSPCPICGEPLLWGDIHVDHAPPHTFEALFDFFLIESGLRHSDIRTEDVNVSNCQFTDRALAARWQQYHAEMANLRAIHKHENLARVA